MKILSQAFVSSKKSRLERGVVTLWTSHVIESKMREGERKRERVSQI